MTEIEKFIESYTKSTQAGALSSTERMVVTLAMAIKKDMDVFHTMPADVKLTETKEFPLTAIQQVTIGNPVNFHQITS